MKIFALLFLVGLSLCAATNDCHQVYVSRTSVPVFSYSSLGPATKEIAMTLSVNQGELEVAKNKLSDSKQTKNEEREKVEIRFNEELATLNVSQKQAQEWITSMVNSGFLLGHLHEIAFVIATVPKYSSEYYAPSVSTFDKQTFLPLTKVYSSTPGTPDYIKKNEHVISQLKALETHFGISKWQQKDEVAKSEIFSYFDKKFIHYKLKKEVFYKQMEILSEIMNQAEGPKFMRLILDQSGLAMSKLVTKENESFANIVTKSLAGVGGGASAIASFFLFPSDPTAFAIAIPGAVGVISTILSADHNNGAGRLNRMSGYWKRRKAKKELIANGADFLKLEKEGIADNQVKQLEEVESDFETNLFQIRSELNQDIVAKPVLLPVWGQKFAAAFNEMLFRIENFEQRYQLIVGDSDQVISRLSKEGLSLEKIKANGRLTVISKDALYRLIIDLQNLRTDIVAMSLALDQYVAKLTLLENTPGFSNVNMSFLITQRKNAMEAEIRNLVSISEVVNRQNAIVLRDLDVLTQVEQVIASDRITRLIKK